MPGDVIFINGKNKSAFWSGFIQRALFDHGRLHRPWFSHVAIALDDRIAYEASPSTFETWSESDLPLGVRLILMIDLLVAAKDVVVLRSPQASTIPPDEFKISSPHVAGLYGGAYSLFSLKKEAENLIPIFAKAVPDKYFEKSTAPDEIAKMLIEDPNFWKDLKEHMPKDVVAQTSRHFFCSQLVLEILVHAGLLKDAKELKEITPSSLYDKLIDDRWTDVSDSDYAPAATEWRKLSKSTWQASYLEDVGIAKYWHNYTYVGSALLLARKRVNDVNDHLDDLGDKFAKLSGR
jgi:hypothetical protein